MSAPGNSSDKRLVNKRDFNLPLSNSRAHRRNEARKRQAMIVEEQEVDLLKPRIPISVKVKARPGDSAHLFSAPVNGEISDIRVKAAFGDSQKEAPIRLSLMGRTEDVVIERNSSFEMPKPLQMKAGDEFSVEVKSKMDIIATMMFREE